MNGATPSLTVGSSLWMVVGQTVYLTGGGYYSVASKADATHVVLTNLGYTGNAAPAANVATGATVSPGGLQGSTGPAGPLTGTTSGTFRGFATVSIDVGSTSTESVGCATATFTGAVTTDRVLATPLSMPNGFGFASASVSAANTVQVCLSNTNAFGGSQNPSAINVFVEVYIP